MRDIYVSRFDVRYIVELRASKNIRCDLKMRALLKTERQIDIASHVSTTARSQSASQRDPVSQCSDASHKRNISHISVASLKLI